MDETKPWYASKTIWASILQVLVGVAVSTGFLGDSAGETIIAEGPELIAGAVVGALGLVSLYGRAFAKKTIAPSTNT
jgi:uncharacterized membrane protein (DUF441 family)